MRQVDWEARRYEIARDVMASIAADPYISQAGMTDTARLAVAHADALIAELRKKSKPEEK